MSLRVASFFVPASPGEHFSFWETGLGRKLPGALGRVDLFPVIDQIKAAPDGYDIAYCQPWLVPPRRPAKFVYSFLSDYRGHEGEIAAWMERARPSFLGCLQQAPPELVAYGKERGCLVELLPWFVEDAPAATPKSIDVMCSGCVDPAIYPSRHSIFKHLSGPRFAGRAKLSCSRSFGHYPLRNDEYRRVLSSAKYYASGGIYDQWIPPKYYEVLNYGACLLSFPMPHMRECGFIDGETFIELHSLEDVDRAIDSGRFAEIGPRGMEMVRSRHTVEARAKRILEVYHESVG